VLEKSKLAKKHRKKATKYVGNKPRSCRLNEHHLQEIKGIRPNSEPSMDISPIWPPINAAEVRKLQIPPVYIEWVNF
jgi:hypothetical protein